MLWNQQITAHISNVTVPIRWSQTHLKLSTKTQGLLGHRLGHSGRRRRWLCIIALSIIWERYFYCHSQYLSLAQYSHFFAQKFPFLCQSGLLHIHPFFFPLLFLLSNVHMMMRIAVFTRKQIIELFLFCE